MTNRFFSWDEFVDSFGAEMRFAEDVYQRMVRSGLKDWETVSMDFDFVSDQPEKLEPLRDCLETRYGYSVGAPVQVEALWEISGKTPPIPITADSLMYWALDLALRGHEFDAKFDAYGGAVDPESGPSADVSPGREEYWFDWALERYGAGDRAAAQWGFSAAIAAAPSDPNAWYSRAIVRNELHTWKAAMRDYDEALRLAPGFSSALLNRGALKDENGDPLGAIEDYERVLASEADEETRTRAWFNRGNSKFRLGDMAGACADWRTAAERGADYAEERIAAHCGGC
jgi:tetratricopeptide (TPR) repeat protein